MKIYVYLISLIFVVKNVNHFLQEAENEGTQEYTKDVTTLHMTEPNSKYVDIIYLFFFLAIILND